MKLNERDRRQFISWLKKDNALSLEKMRMFINIFSKKKTISEITLSSGLHKMGFIGRAAARKNNLK